MSLWCEYGILLYSQSASVILLFCSVRTFNKLISHLLSGEIFPIFYFLLAVLFVVVIIIVDAKKVTSKFSSRLLYPGQAWFFFSQLRKILQSDIKTLLKAKDSVFSIFNMHSMHSRAAAACLLLSVKKKRRKVSTYFCIWRLEAECFSKTKELGSFYRLNVFNI